MVELWAEYTQKSFDSLICEAVEKDICVRQLPIAMQKKENVEWTGGTWLVTVKGYNNIIYIGTILYVRTRATPLNFPTGRLVTFPLAHLTPLVEWLKMYLHPWWGDGLSDRILFFNINCLSSRLEPPCPHLAWVFLSWTRKISNLLLSNSTTR